MEDEDETEKEFLSVEDINIMLKQVDKRERTLVNVLMDQNSDLLDALFDMQEFMQDRGFTSQDYEDWQLDKDDRIYH
tara:strand:- start:168 stop:398 length:231 start_codon:yes stop_codon:yes gene_type:complete